MKALIKRKVPRTAEGSIWAEGSFVRDATETREWGNWRTASLVATLRQWEVEAAVIKELELVALRVNMRNGLASYWYFWATEFTDRT